MCVRHHEEVWEDVANNHELAWWEGSLRGQSTIGFRPLPFRMKRIPEEEIEVYDVESKEDVFVPGMSTG